MSRESFYLHYENLYRDLKEIIKASEDRVLMDKPDELFMVNTNFFVKAYLISLCTYLEAYLQDVAFMYANELNARIIQAEIPHNFVHWRIVKEVKEEKLDFKNITLEVEKKEISDNLSGNPYKTIKLFKYLGIDLLSTNDFKDNKDKVNSVVMTRNNIVHHNDKAINITFSDLITHIDVFLIYIKSIDDITMLNIKRLNKSV